MVADAGRLCVIPTASIELLCAQGNYVELHLEGRKLLMRGTLSHIESKLDPARFLRIHRSRIIRTDLVEQIEPYAAGQYWLRLRNGVSVTSGRHYRERLLRAYGLIP